MFLYSGRRRRVLSGFGAQRTVSIEGKGVRPRIGGARLDEWCRVTRELRVNKKGG